MAELAFDLNIARQMVDSFALASSIRCRLVDAAGNSLYQHGEPEDECSYMKSLPGDPPPCEKLHLRGIAQAERFGGRYIYSCPAGLTYFTAPIIIGNAVVGALIGGPVLIVEPEDMLDDVIQRRGVPSGGIRPVRQFFDGLPQVEPTRLNHISTQLCTNALYISDLSHATLMLQGESSQQQSIGEYVHQVKSAGANVPYPISKEQELTTAIAQGDKSTASALLNDILGHIFFFTHDTRSIPARILELLVVLSRAAIYGGGLPEVVFETTERYMNDLQKLNSQEAIAHWLARVLNQYTDMVFDMVDSKHKNIIRKAVSYIKCNYVQDICLADVANHVGYSPSHFSKVFKEEMGCGFRVYLNQIRVEKSKAYLLNGMFSIAEICSLCGFEDQSYYCKVFKKFTGVTPDKFRKQARRIDKEREYGA